MASVRASFMYLLALLPLLTRGDEPDPCVLPFTYNGKTFNSCTKENDNKLWCSTTAKYESKWKYCAPNEYGGNTNGNRCVFPYIYKDRVFYTCTNENEEKGRFWCATTGSYDQDKQWSYCADTRLTAGGQGPCVFPFIYRGKAYSACTTDGDPKGQPWCSLTSNYDQNPRWVYCKAS